MKRRGFSRKCLSQLHVQFIFVWLMAESKLASERRALCGSALVQGDALQCRKNNTADLLVRMAAKQECSSGLLKHCNSVSTHVHMSSSLSCTKYRIIESIIFVRRTSDFLYVRTYGPEGHGGCVRSVSVLVPGSKFSSSNLLPGKGSQANWLEIDSLDGHALS